MRYFLLLCVALGLAGCGTVYNTPEAVTAASTVSGDAYTGVTTVAAPRIDAGHWRIDNWAALVCHFKGKERTYGLAFHEYRPSPMLVGNAPHTGWAFYNRAYDIHQVQLPTASVKRTVGNGGGDLSEDIVITLSRAWLNRARTEGVNIKLMGDNDSIVILMPPLYVEGFLRKVDASAQ